MSNFHLFLWVLLCQPFLSSGDNSYQMNSWLTGNDDYGSPPSSGDAQKESVIQDAMTPNQAPAGMSNVQYPQYPPAQQVQQHAGPNYPPQAPNLQRQVNQNSHHVQQIKQHDNNGHHAVASQHQQHPQRQIQNVQGQSQPQMIQGQQYPSMNGPLPPAQPPNHAVSIHVQQRPPQAPVDHANKANFNPNPHLQSGPGQGPANNPAVNQQALNTKPELPQEEGWKAADEPNPWFFEEAKPPPAFSAEDERIRQEKFGSMKDKWQIEDEEAKKQGNLKNNQGQVVYEQAYAHRGDFTGEGKRIGSGAILSVSKNNQYQPVGNPMPPLVPDPNFSKVPKNFYEGKIQHDPNSKLILEQTYGNWEHPRKNNPRSKPPPPQPPRQGQQHTMDDPPASIQFRKQWYDDTLQSNGESGGISLARKVKVPLSQVVCSALIVWNL